MCLHFCHTCMSEIQEKGILFSLYFSIIDQYIEKFSPLHLLCNESHEVRNLISLINELDRLELVSTIELTPNVISMIPKHITKSDDEDHESYFVCKCKIKI